MLIKMWRLWFRLFTWIVWLAHSFPQNFAFKDQHHMTCLHALKCCALGACRQSQTRGVWCSTTPASLSPTFMPWFWHCCLQLTLCAAKHARMRFPCSR